MTATTSTAVDGQLDIGRVIQQTFGVLGRNFSTFLLLALILTGLPSMILGYFQAEAVRTSTPGYGGALLTSLAAMITGLVLQGALIYGTVGDLNGRRPSVSDSLSVGLRSFLPILGLGILIALGVAFGLMLLVVPGIMLAVAWSVAIPALVAERTGVFAAFGRSAQLTRGNRRRIFGLVVIYMIAAIIVGAIIAVFGGLAAVGGAGGAIPIVQAVVIQPLTNVVGALLGATGGAVLYAELRRVKEGASPEALAAVFD
jgi:MFS family permease